MKFTVKLLSLGLLYTATTNHKYRRSSFLQTTIVARCHPLPDNYAITSVSPAICLYTSVTDAGFTRPHGLTTSSSSSDNHHHHRPLAILFCWLMAKPKHINKYAVFYLDKGYDVLTVRISPWQMLWPTKCIAIVENEILPALTTSTHEKKIVHGFSAGGFIFGEILKCFKHDPIKYYNLITTIKAQIWDSVVDVNAVSLGVSKAIYYKSVMLQRTLEAYVDFHMWLFYSQSTKYYNESRDYFYHSPLKVPALFLTSRRDTISSLDRIHDVIATWEKLGIPCTLKVWEDSDHVAHMKRYPDEYKRTVATFLDDLIGNKPGGGDVRGGPPSTNPVTPPSSSTALNFDMSTKNWG